MKPIDVKLDFEEYTPDNLGRPKFFDPDHYLDSVEQMLAADEVIIALKMLDQMPGYYRMHPPKRALELKKQIYANIWNVSAYSDDEYETYDNSLKHQMNLNKGFGFESIGLSAMIDIPFCYPRGPLVVQEIKALNEQGIIPHIYEMGPANYYLPYGLHHKELKFTYYADTLNKKAFADHKERLEKLGVWKEKPDADQKQLFVCFETIEHLWDEKDILHQYHRYGCDADLIMLSTPCCTLLGGMPDYKRDLGHLRTFTPKELFQICVSFWPTHEWSECLNHMMVLVGRRRELK